MYLSGFGNHHQSEALKGALPENQNAPQQCNFGLYAEQLSGTAFTRARHKNQHSWLYRILPSVAQQDYELYSHSKLYSLVHELPPNPFRWSALKKPEIQQDFIDGWFHLAGNKRLNTFIYRCNYSMEKRYFSNHDGELLLVPYQGRMRLRTEFGCMDVTPGMIAVIPRGVKFKVELQDSYIAGYICENQGISLTLPELGPIGANGLAHPRHFLYPCAAFEDLEGETTLVCKYQNNWWVSKSDHSPLNVVAWHGNYAPYCYDLSLFNTINTVSFDHPDPSIFTVLTSESDTPGVANLDFVIFPPRWMVAEHTFRPPYYHRNVMNEFMGLITGQYDAKKEGFEVGGVSIHNYMTPHGPDVSTYQEASTKELKPEYYDNTLAFMFESSDAWLITKQALDHESRQLDYTSCWQGLSRRFQVE